MNQTLKWITTMKKECPTCTGSGTISCKCNDNNEIACPNCGGKGVVTRRATTTQKRRCPVIIPNASREKYPAVFAMELAGLRRESIVPAAKGKVR